MSRCTTRRALCGLLLVLAASAQPPPDYVLLSTGDSCPYAVGDRPKAPPLFEGWQEGAQFEASASHYLHDHDLDMINTDAPSNQLNFVRDRLTKCSVSIRV